MASDERLSSVTRSTEIENKVLIFQNIEIDIDQAIKRNKPVTYLLTVVIGWIFVCRAWIVDECKIR